MLVIAGYSIFNLIIKLEKLEEITEAQLEKLNYNLDKLTGLYLGMKEIDSTGAFESDDEVGSTFTDLKNLIEKNLKDLEEING